MKTTPQHRSTRPILPLATVLAVALGTACGPSGSPPADTPADSPAAAATGLRASADSASAVVRRYYRAIQARRYHEAFSLWGHDGRDSGQSYDAFVAGFAHTDSVAAEVGPPGRVEGAAGSWYVEIPVVVRALTDTGERQRFEGSYTLRRVVVEGASAAERRWHLYSADLAPVR